MLDFGAVLRLFAFASAFAPALALDLVLGITAPVAFALALAAPRSVNVWPRFRPRRLFSGNVSLLEVASRNRKFNILTYSTCSQLA